MGTAGRLLIVAGEASGDLYGALLFRAVRALDPQIHAVGIGGVHMRTEGVSLFADSRELAVVGLGEVLSHWKPIREAYRRSASLLREDRPDLLILIDYPDFNLRLAREARRQGIPVLYFVSPQVWAWRASRVQQIARTVDLMLVILPFEEEIYRRAGVSVRFVGHPLVDLLPPSWSPREARSRLGLDPARTVVGLLPGSRRREIGFHLPVMLETAARIREEYPDVQFVIPLASTLGEPDFGEALRARSPGAPEIRLLRGAPGEVLSTMDAAVVKSGTATLEAALMGIPMVIIYRTSVLTYLLASLLTDIHRIGLVNIVAGKPLVPELIQGDCTPVRIASSLNGFLRDPLRAAETRREMIALRTRLGRPGCFQRTAAAVLELLQARPPGRAPQVLP